MKSVIGSNYGQGSIYENPTIEKDDLEENDSHNTDDSYSTYQGNFNLIQKLMFTKMLALEIILLKEMMNLGKIKILLKEMMDLGRSKILLKQMLEFDTHLLI